VKPALLIISPDYPPRRGGIADHTQRLAREFALERQISVLTSRGEAKDDWAKVYPLIDDWSDVDQLFVGLESIARVDVVLWQYVPHMYGHGGVNLKLPRALWHLQKHQRPQLVLAHEIAAPYSAWPHRFYYAWAHRSQWRRLLNAADAVGISTEAWLEEWRQQRQDVAANLFLAPSPSNIDVVEVPAGHRQTWRERHGLSPQTRVLAYFGTLSEAKQFDWVVKAWEAAQSGGPTALAVIGEKPDTSVRPELAALFKPLGFLSHGEVSSALRAADVLALPFVDGASERRTTFMAGLSHGCAVVSTIGANTGSSLRASRAFASVPVDDPEAFAKLVAELLADSPRREAMGREAAEVYARHYDWPVLVGRIKEQMVP
jgi:glycosyltransferase involved in cell wall biosynthesis